MRTLPVRTVTQVNHDRVMEALLKGPVSYYMDAAQVQSIRQTAFKVGLHLNYKRVLKAGVVVGWTLSLEKRRK